jgi:hypothetical protein
MIQKEPKVAPQPGLLFRDFVDLAKCQYYGMWSKNQFGQMAWLKVKCSRPFAFLALIFLVGSSITGFDVLTH